MKYVYIGWVINFIICLIARAGALKRNSYCNSEMRMEMNVWYCTGLVPYLSIAIGALVLAEGKK